MCNQKAHMTKNFLLIQEFSKFAKFFLCTEWVHIMLSQTLEYMTHAYKHCVYKYNTPPCCNFYNTLKPLQHPPLQHAFGLITTRVLYRYNTPNPLQHPLQHVKTLQHPLTTRLLAQIYNTLYNTPCHQKFTTPFTTPQNFACGAHRGTLSKKSLRNCCTEQNPLVG